MGVLLLAVAGAAAYVLQRDDGQVPSRLAQTPTCVRPAATAAPTTSPAARATPALPQPAQVRLALFNGTARNGLAKMIGDQLAADGFVVTTQANAPAALAGSTQVAYGPGALPAATVASGWVIGSTVVASPRLPRGAVQITLGSDFHRLATPIEAAGRLRRPVVTAAPVASTPAPSASGCPS